MGSEDIVRLSARRLFPGQSETEYSGKSLLSEPYC